MPIYEYKCSKCKRSFSVLQKTGTSEKDTVCPDCGSNTVKNCCPHSHVLLPEAIHSPGSSGLPGRACGGGG